MKHELQKKNVDTAVFKSSPQVFAEYNILLHSLYLTQ